MKRVNSERWFDIKDYKGEIWKDIIITKHNITHDFTGLYKVSNFGRIKSLNFKNSGIEKIMKFKTKEKGYKFICLYKNGVRHWLHVHRIVAEAFIPNIYNKPDVNHKDTKKKNNEATNLEWVTKKENMEHASNEGLINTTAVYQLNLEGKILRKWDSITEAERKLKINNASICSCCSGKYKTAGGYIWKYTNKERRK